MIPFIARHWPFANGSGRILDKFGGWIDLGSGERTVKTSDGFQITVLADDLIGRHILMTGRFDRAVVQVMLNHARPGDVLADIGANIGYVAGCFLQLVKDSRAVCFEPQPEIAKLLKCNLLQFGPRAEIHQVGLSDRNGMAEFHVDSVNRGASRIAEGGGTQIPLAEAAKVFRRLERVDAVKIDVEGHELPIFRSLEPELKRLRPRVILFEDQTDSEEIKEILSRCGYEVFGIEKRLMSTRLNPTAIANDYLALPATFTSRAHRLP